MRSSCRQSQWVSFWLNLFALSPALYSILQKPLHYPRGCGENTWVYRELPIKRPVSISKTQGATDIKKKTTALRSKHPSGSTGHKLRKGVTRMVEFKLHHRAGVKYIRILEVSER